MSSQQVSPVEKAEADFEVIVDKGYIVLANGRESGELITKESALDFIMEAKKIQKDISDSDYQKVRDKILASELPSIFSAPK